jgi:hypothetical protein
VKSLLFATSYAENDEQLQRLKFYIEYYRSKLDRLNCQRLVLFDDASPLDVLEKLNVPIFNLKSIIWQHKIEEEVSIFRFPKNLGRPVLSIMPGWWRSFSFTGIFADHYGIDRMVHIESDAYILTDRLFDFMSGINDYWTTFYSNIYLWPESAIQVIPRYSKLPWVKETKKNFVEIQNFFKMGADFWYKNCLANFTYLPEHRLPFDRICKDFIGDRYGDMGMDIPVNADYATNVTPETVQKWFKGRVYA